MGIIKQAADLVYTFRFLRLLTTNFEDTDAYKMGLIDEKGKRQQKPDTAEERNAYTSFHRLVFNIKKLVPGGKIGSYASALYLVKENFSITDRQLSEALKYANMDPLDLLAENTQWFVLEDKRLSPGLYKVHEHKVLNDTCDELVYPKDKVRVDELCYPVGDVFGLDVYEATHVKTNQTVYVTVGELSR